MFDGVLDQHLPSKNKRVKRRSQPPWMNDEILKLISERDGPMKTAGRTNLSIDWYLYTRAKCKTSTLIKHAKRCFFQETIGKNKGNSKGIWKALKTSSGVKRDQFTIRQLITERGAITDKQEIVEYTNDAFINIASQIISGSQCVADLDLDDVALLEFVRSKSGNQSFEYHLLPRCRCLISSTRSLQVRWLDVTASVRRFLG